MSDHEARLPAGRERATLTFDRCDVRRSGAREMASRGRLGAAVRLILRNRVARPGIKASELELRLRQLEVRELELLAEQSESDASRDPDVWLARFARLTE
jgi:hypothetical protein